MHSEDILKTYTTCRAEIHNRGHDEVSGRTSYWHPGPLFGRVIILKCQLTWEEGGIMSASTDEVIHSLHARVLVESVLEVFIAIHANGVGYDRTTVDEIGYSSKVGQIA
jgi:hypothetical protein